MMQPPDDMNTEKISGRLAAVLLVLVFLYATTYQLPFMAAVDWVQATDVYSYLHISGSAPGLPAERIAYHFSQRWIPHYLVGIVSVLFSVDLGMVYTLTVLFLIFAIAWISFGVLRQSTPNAAFACLLFLIVSLSAFSYRLIIFVPGLLIDLVCVLGLAITLSGLVNRRVGWILFGMVVATLGKQLSLLLLPGVLLYALAVFGRTEGRRAALMKCFWIGAVTVGTYALLIATSAHFAYPNSITRTVLFALFPWLVSAQFSVSGFAEHISRVLVPLLPFIGIFMLACWKRVTGREMLRRLMALENVALILMVLGPMAYAFLPGPQVQMGNQSRYVALSMLPMALLTLRCAPAVQLDLAWGDYLWLGVVLCGISYHHRYTVVQATPGVFVAVHLLSLLCLLGWFAWKMQAGGRAPLPAAQEA
jgi:hypothetical protein